MVAMNTSYRTVQNDGSQDGVFYHFLYADASSIATSNDVKIRAKNSEKNTNADFMGSLSYVRNKGIYKGAQRRIVTLNES